MSNPIEEASELRKDPVLDRWVIIAASRGKRPTDFASPPEPDKSAGCPFCGGNETKTPPEIAAARAAGTGPNTPGWEVRVVQNKFPALTIEASLRRSGIGLMDRMGGFGAHEVIIETPRHDEDLALAPVDHIDTVFQMYRARLEDLRRDPRFRHILIFRNYRSAAGASLSHPHSQLIALPIVPLLVKEKLNAAQAYFRHKERCIFCDLLEQELTMPDRVVVENEDFVVLSPFAARSPFELMILPRRHMHDFTLMTSAEQHSFADIMKDVLMRYRNILNDPAYNMMLQTAPNIVTRPGHPEYWGTLMADYHWHVELMPRVTKTAGFEWGTGFYINPVSPEKATMYLRGEVEEEHQHSAVAMA
jgi:UDPglucose--hexose-1-phosphate uridylyltransferase